MARLVGQTPRMWPVGTATHETCLWHDQWPVADLGEYLRRQGQLDYEAPTMTGLNHPTSAQWQVLALSLRCQREDRGLR